MRKKIIIIDYKGDKKEIEVKNFENVESISVEIISGDEVITLFFKDGHYEKYDSSNTRCMSFFDGEYSLPLDKVDEFSNFNGDSYDKQSYFDSFLNYKKEV